MKLDNYILNKNKTLEELLQFGIINGGGKYAIEYAYGNYIYFSPNSYKFIECGGWYRDTEKDYQTLLTNKINCLIENEIILERVNEE